MQLTLIMPFLNEERFLPQVLDAIAGQQRRPDSLLLVDDGSSDRSLELASAFAREHEWATVLSRPRRPPMTDRMVEAHELQAFAWALDRLPTGWEVAAKFDADIRLTALALAEVEQRLLDDPKLGIAGPYLDEEGDAVGGVQQRPPDWHVRGAVKFYRRACWEDISPLPPILGWDTLDEVRAQMNGWRTASFRVPSGNPVHLRRTGSHDGVLRGYRRAGLAAYAYGAHPLHVLASATVRLRDRPRPLCGVNYLAGWVAGAARRAPRAECDARKFVRRENLRRLRRVATGTRNTRGNSAAECDHD